MSLVDDDTLLRDSELEAMREVTEPDEPDTDHASAPEPEPPPTTISHYVLLSKLGQGGMGVVHAAYDERLDRKVAIKLLRTPNDRKAHKRLVREAQSLAKLSHPNVVQIYEIGTSGELTFLVMEFVKGHTLRAWLNQQPRSRAEILAVFAAAGRGLAAAHAVGLVHRDFKPDNVMIRDDGRVMVMDFGLAHLVREGDRIDGSGSHDGGPSLHEPSGLTATGMLVGTPAYMAPEQFERRHTDARTDQFSFCVALWEALYGMRPFAGATLMELSVAVCSGTVRTPVQTDVPGWLRKVLLRALAVEPEQRWPSIEALLDALGRDPTGQRRALALGLGLLATLMGSTAALRVTHQRELDRAQRACVEAGQSLDWNTAVQDQLAARFSATGLGYADSAWAHTRTLLDAYARSWSEARTRVCVEAEIEGWSESPRSPADAGPSREGLSKNLRSPADAGPSREGWRDADSYAAITACLDERRAAFHGLLDAWAELDETAIARATSAAAGLTPVSLCTDERQLAQRMQPPAELHDAAVELRRRIEAIAALHFAGKFEQARARSLQVLSEAEALGWTPLIAEARYTLGAQLHRLGDYEAARAALEQSFAEALGAGHDIAAFGATKRLTVVVGDKLAQVERGLYWGQLGRRYLERLGLQGSIREALLLDDIGTVHARAGNNDEALALHDRALVLIEAELGSQHIHTASVLNNIGSAHWNKGEYAEALAAFERALAIKIAMLGAEHPDVATLLNNMGAVAWGQGDYAAALQLFERALAARERAFGPAHPDVASTLGNIGAAQALLGRADDSLNSFQRALALQEQALGPDHPDLAGTLVNVAIGLRDHGRIDEALAHQQRALAILEASLGPEHPHVAMALNNIAISQMMQRQFEQARATHERALAIRTAALGPEHPDVAMSLLNLATVLVNQREFDAAIELYRRALAIRETALGPEHPSVAEALEHLGTALRERGELDDALTHYRRALQIRTTPDGEHPDLAISLAGIALILAERGELDDALAHVERGLAVREAADAPPEKRGMTEFIHAQVLWRAGRIEQARESADRARAHFEAAAAQHLLADLDAWLAEVGER